MEQSMAAGARASCCCSYSGAAAGRDARRTCAAPPRRWDSAGSLEISTKGLFSRIKRAGDSRVGGAERA
eukprot:27543-Chlamydomonas_euryale.AAC.8